MNPCPDRELLAAYADRRLEAGDRDTLEAHLAACPGCRAEAVALAALVAQVAASDRVPSAEFHPRALALLRPRRWGWAVAASVAAAALLAIGVLLRNASVETVPPAQVYVPPKPEPTPEPPKSEPQPTKPDPNRVVLATVQDTEGQVWLLQQGNQRPPATLGAELLPGQGLFTHNGTAVVAYADGTTVEISASTRIPRFVEAEGKRIELAEGTIRAQVAKQPAGKPLVIATPHGEATVVGTTLRLTAEKTGTHLEVEEGRVQLKGVDVLAGHVAFAAPGAEPSLRPFGSLRGHWKLDDGAGMIAADATGLGNDARLKEKTEWTPQGRSGGALECRKAGFYVVPFHAGGRPFPGFTAAFWIHHEELDDWQDVYISVPGFSIVREGNLQRGRIRVMFRTNETSPNLAIDAVVRPKEWMHLALTWDGETARLYRNGLEVGSGRVTGVLEPPRSVSIGAEVDGKMDDVRLYRRALTLPEIGQVMNGGEVK